MKDVKIRVYGIEELSERVQKELFRLGASWDGNKVIKWELMPYLYVSDDDIGYSNKSEEEFFNNCVEPEVTLQDLIDMQPEPKKRQEKFYQWASFNLVNCLRSTDYLYNENGYYYREGKLVHDGNRSDDIKQGKAWKLNPDNPVILEVEE